MMGVAVPEGVPIPEKEITSEQLTEWAAVYDTQHRQLRRYILTGRERNDPCPLEDPTKMPAWWARNMKQRVPLKILNAAQKAKQPAPEAPAPQQQPHPSVPSPAPVEGGFDLDGATIGDGEEVRIARGLVASFKEKVTSALRDNRADDVQLWNRHLKDALESLRKAKIADAEHQKTTGAFILKSAVELEVFQALKLLASMRENMAKLVAGSLRTSLPELEEATIAAVVSAVEAERRREDEVFRNLSALKSPQDVFRLVS